MTRDDLIAAVYALLFVAIVFALSYSFAETVL